LVDGRSRLAGLDASLPLDWYCLRIQIAVWTEARDRSVVRVRTSGTGYRRGWRTCTGRTMAVGLQARAVGPPVAGGNRRDRGGANGRRGGVAGYTREG